MFPLVAGKGISLLHLRASCCRRRPKKRGWTTQHRPTSNPSKALPDSPGRAARKPAEKEALSLSGTEVLQLPDDSWREWLRETSFQGLCFSFGDPQNKISASSAASKNSDCRRIRLQRNCRRFGLEGSQDHIKLLHVASAVLGTQKENPPEKLVPGDSRF